MFDDHRDTGSLRQQRPGVGGCRRHEAANDRNRGFEFIACKERHVFRLSLSWCADHTQDQRLAAFRNLTENPPHRSTRPEFAIC